ncbi:MAG: hypothetical protein P8Z42_00390 [Anaerolineales bacterium]
MGRPIMQLKTQLGEVADLASSIAVLHWDQQTYMPSGGAEERAMQIATLSRLAHELATSDEMGAAIEAAKAEVGDLDSPSDDARLVRKADRDYTKEKKVTSAWVTEFRRRKPISRNSNRSWRKSSTCAGNTPSSSPPSIIPTIPCSTITNPG